MLQLLPSTVETYCAYLLVSQHFWILFNHSIFYLSRVGLDRIEQGLTSHLTHFRSFRRRESYQVSLMSNYHCYSAGELSSLTFSLLLILLPRHNFLELLLTGNAGLKNSPKAEYLTVL